MYQDDLAKLSRDELIALGLALAAQIEVLAAQITELARRVAELEAKLGQPPKTPDNSSVPPSQGRRSPTAPNGGRQRRSARADPASSGRLADNPDRIVETRCRALPALRASELRPA